MDRRSANSQHSCSTPVATTHSLWLSSLGSSWTSPLCTMFCRSFSYLQSLSPSPHLFQLNLSAFVSLLPPPFFNLSVSTSSSQQVTGITSLSLTSLVSADVSPQTCCPQREILPHRLSLCQTQEIQSISAMDFVPPLQKLQQRTPKAD